MKKKTKAQQTEITAEKERVGEQIRRLRKALGMSQMQLADKMGITYQQVQKYEKGVSDLTMRRLRQVSASLNVPVSTFIPQEKGINEPENPYLSAAEAELLTLFRKLKKKRLKSGFVEMLKDIVEIAR